MADCNDTKCIDVSYLKDISNFKNIPSSFPLTTTVKEKVQRRFLQRKDQYTLMVSLY